jgi:hypothetical protein
MGIFDRGYEYDHVGRIKEALSGREARGLPVLSYPDNPFRQSYTYDVWDNMKRPSNRHWSANLPDTPTYTNNRRSDATYDEEGNVLLRDRERKQHAYDAAGRQRYFLEQEWGCLSTLTKQTRSISPSTVMVYRRSVLQTATRRTIKRFRGINPITSTM